MDIVLSQFFIVGVILLAGFSGPAIAVVFMLRRKRRARARRRSPIGKDLLRSPGHSLRGQMDQLHTEVDFDLLQLMFLPLLMLTVFLAQGHVMGLDRVMPLTPVFVGLAVAAVGWTIRKLLSTSKQLDRLRAGYDAELAVGQELDQLMRQGAVVFHELPADGFNIDHVVISAQGVFAVETKGYTKPKRGSGKGDATVRFDGKMLSFPTWQTSDPLEQAERQAVWLAKWLVLATGSPIAALPVVALPGWFVERTGRGNVRVFNGKELAGLLNARGAQMLSPQQVQQVAHQVEQRCRTVAPTYAEMSKSS